MFKHIINKYEAYKNKIDYSKYQQTTLMLFKYVENGNCEAAFAVSKRCNIIYPIDFNFRKAINNILRAKKTWKLDSLIEKWKTGPQSKTISIKTSYNCLFHEAEFIAIMKEKFPNAIRDIDLNFMGECYFYGCGVDKDINKALGYWQLAAKKGCCAAMYNLAMCYYYGYGVKQNMKNVIYCLEHAAEIHHVIGVNELVSIYHYGIDCEKDDQRALDILQQSNLGKDYIRDMSIKLQFDSLVNEIKSQNFTDAQDIKKYILDNKLGYKYNFLGEDNIIKLDISANYINMKGSLSPKFYRQLMETLNIKYSTAGKIINEKEANRMY